MGHCSHSLASWGYLMFEEFTHTYLMGTGVLG